MKRTDKRLIRDKLQKSIHLAHQGSKTLYAHHTTGYYKDFPYYDHGHGTRIVDIDGNEYLDFAMGLGPLILGHSHPAVTEAICSAARSGGVHSFGEPYEVRLAEIMVEAISYVDAITVCNSGTEATMHAIKMARAYTKREKIAKFEGCYHGTHDYAQISGRFSKAGPIENPQSVPDFGGIPAYCSDNVITLSFNHKSAFDTIARLKDQLAAVIIEPVPLMFPQVCPEFLAELREITQKNNIVLIFDEVMIGFRFGYGGTDTLLHVSPDLATYGKLVGGGLPIGVIGGKREYMETLNMSSKMDIKRKVYTTGTFNGNRITCAAAAATLEFIRDNQHLYQQMESLTHYIITEIESYASMIDFPFQIKGIISILVPYFHADEINNTRDTRWPVNAVMFDLLRKYMLKYGVALGDIGAIFLSMVHTKEDCVCFVNAFKNSLKDMQ